MRKVYPLDALVGSHHEKSDLHEKIQRFASMRGISQTDLDNEIKLRFGVDSLDSLTIKQFNDLKALVRALPQLDNRS